jgi:hypothetical protein
MFLYFVSRALEVTSCSQQLQRSRPAAAAASPLKICFWFCVVFVIMCNEGTLGCKYERFAFQREWNRDVVAWLVDEAAVFYLQLQVRFLKRTSSSEPPKQISPHFNTSAVANKKIGNLLLTCYHMRCCGGNSLQKNNMTHPCEREAWRCARQWKRNYRR